MNRYNWLEKQLDREDITEAEYKLYDDELNVLQDVINASKERNKQLQLAKELQKQEELMKIKAMFTDGKTNELVEQYGQQFIGDYTISGAFDVISFAFNDCNPNQQKVWQCHTHSAAVKKLNYLLYHRVYDFYIRNSDEA